MRERWRGPESGVALGLADLTALVQPAFPGQQVVDAHVAEGGLSNTSIRLQLSGRSPPLLMRLYRGGPSQLRKEHALNRLTWAHVPVPRFLHASESNPSTGHAYVLMDWIDGERLETVAPALDGPNLARLGRSIGVTLARIHAITFPHPGFFSSNLEIEEPIGDGSEAFVRYLREFLVGKRGGDRLGVGETAAVLAFAEREGRLLDTWHPSAHLVHGDFGGSNILVRQEGSGWQVAAVLDWEFAFSGSPLHDFGNLLRPPLGTLRGFESTIIDGYRSAGGELPRYWRRMSRLVDMLAWAEFLSRPEPSAALIENARSMLLGTMRDLDRPAVPD